MSSAAIAPETVPYGLFEAVASRKMLVGQFFAFAFWMVATGFGMHLKPSPFLHGIHQELGLPPCPSALFFDRPCPGCGLTTSWTALLHGDIPMAFHAHALGPLLYLCFTIACWLCMIGFVRVQRFRSEARWFQTGATTVFILLITYGVIRFALTPHYAAPYERAMIGAKV